MMGGADTASSPGKSDGFSQPPPDVSRHPVVMAGYCAVFLACLLIAVTATLRQSSRCDKHSAQDSRGEEESGRSKPKVAGSKTAFVTLGVLVIVLLTGALRSATLRTRRMQPIIGTSSFASGVSLPLKEPEPVVVWNHRETDEVIFEVRVTEYDPYHVM
jgi:hypothetical protein